jgi:hypothetical protein
MLIGISRADLRFFHNLGTACDSKQHPISMSISINSIVEANQPLVRQRQAEIQFDIDAEGKRILIQKTSRFYAKRLIDKAEIADIILTSFVVIEKMSKLSECQWTAIELYEGLYSGVRYYENSFNVDLRNWFNNEANSNPEFKDELSEKFPATFKAIDGHYVRSEGEQTIDNFLFRNGIIHAYEKRLPGDKCVYCDFYIPPGDKIDEPVYIEYWGVENDEAYLERKKTKLEIYKREHLQLIEITRNELENLKTYLTEKLMLFHFHFA